MAAANSIRRPDAFTRSRRVRLTAPTANTSWTFSCISLLLICLVASRASASSVLPARALSRGLAPGTSTLTFDRSLPPTSLVRRQEDGTESPPAPFDTGFGETNMTTSCASFFRSFLQDAQMASCQPISLLLMTSSSFFQSSKTTTSLQDVVSQSCAASKTSCSQKMASYATQIKAPANCGQDYQRQNPYVLKAYDGFLAYDALYDASCMKSNGGYCFVDAMTDAQSPDSSYIYYLPLGVDMPAGANPACNSCMQQTMNDWATTATNGSTPLSSAYNSAASQIDASCGGSFAKQVATPKPNAGLRRSVPTWTLGLAIAACVWLF